MGLNTWLIMESDEPEPARPPMNPRYAWLLLFLAGASLLASVGTVWVVRHFYLYLNH